MQPDAGRRPQGSSGALVLPPDRSSRAPSASTRLRARTAARRSTRWSNSPLRRRIRSSVVRRTMTRTPPPCGASPSAARLPRTPSFSMERWRWFRRTNERAFHRHSPRKSATSGACAPQGLSGRTQRCLARSRFWAHPVGDLSARSPTVPRRSRLRLAAGVNRGRPAPLHVPRRRRARPRCRYRF
jgi:hypothetical protein